MIGPAELEDLLLDLEAAAAADGVSPPHTFHPAFWSVADHEPPTAEAAVETRLDASP